MKQWDIPGQSSSSSGLPKGSAKGIGKSTEQSRRFGEQERKRYKPQAQDRLQAVERLTRNTAALSQRTACTVAFLFSQVSSVV